jgi:hypothetical protein
MAPVLHLDTVARAVADSLGVREEPEQPLTRGIASGLAEQRMLLILCNCEHLLRVRGQLVDELLRARPGLNILATSRERAPGGRLRSTQAMLSTFVYVSCVSGGGCCMASIVMGRHPVQHRRSGKSRVSAAALNQESPQ